MAAILCNITPGDEVIAPSYTFVSTVNAFVLRGAKVVFADSECQTPNLDVEQLEGLITPRTKVIVPVHYAGIACDMEPLSVLARKYGIYIVEDAAQAIDSYYYDRPLGSLGHLATFSFHETKNIISGEGGMLVVNDAQFTLRAEIIREKGTNRSAFFRGEVDKYGWVDIGSSFLPSEIVAAFLYAQLEHLEEIQLRRKRIWTRYFKGLQPLADKGYVQLPVIPSYATNNGHMFYVLCNSLEERTDLIEYLKTRGVMAVFHYLSLHKSPYYHDKHDGRALPNADKYSDQLVRLPLYYNLTNDAVDYIIEQIYNFFEKQVLEC